MKPTGGELGLDALAAYRLTRLVTADIVMRPTRVWWIRSAYIDAYGPNSDWAFSERSDVEWDDLPESDPDAPAWAAFIKCRWCTGMWISGFVAVARRYAPRVWDPLARALALSAAAALVAGLEE